MSFVALEVSINGEHQYTVGAEEWRTIWAHLLGHRLTPDMFPSEALSAGEELPKDGVTTINFRASVSIPVDGIDNARGTSGQEISTSKTGSYPSATLKVGDTVTIKVVDSDDPDEPVWQSADSRGPTAIRSRAEQE